MAASRRMIGIAQSLIVGMISVSCGALTPASSEERGRSDATLANSPEELGIIGGQPVPEGMAGWVVSLQGEWPNEETKQLELAHWCGGALVAPHLVLTAAHCVINPTEENPVATVSPSILSIVHSKVNLTRANNDTRVKVKRIHLPTNASPVLKGYTIRNDVVVLELEQAIKNVPIAPVNLYSVPAGARPLILGWGIPKPLPAEEDFAFFVDLFKGKSGSRAANPVYVKPSTGDGSNRLLAARGTPVLGNNECQAAFRKGLTELATRTKLNPNPFTPAFFGANPLVTPDMFCLAPSEKVDSCYGDSGSPVTQWNSVNKRLEVVGVVSWGIGCASREFPGVYARLDTSSSFLRRFVK